MKFNVNDRVRVRLTNRGRDLLAATERPPVVREDVEGWSEWQLWALLEVFGGNNIIRDGLPFETEVEVPTSGEVEAISKSYEALRASAAESNRLRNDAAVAWTKLTESQEQEIEALKEVLRPCAEWLRYAYGNVDSVTADKVRAHLSVIEEATK